MKMRIPKEMLPGFHEYTYRRAEPVSTKHLIIQQLAELGHLKLFDLFRFTPDEINAAFSHYGPSLETSEWVDAEFVSTFDKVTFTHRCEIYLLPNGLCRATERKRVAEATISDAMMAEADAKWNAAYHMIHQITVK